MKEASNGGRSFCSTSVPLTVHSIDKIPALGYTDTVRQTVRPDVPTPQRVFDRTERTPPGGMADGKGGAPGGMTGKAAGEKLWPVKRTETSDEKENHDADPAYK